MYLGCACPSPLVLATIRAVVVRKRFPAVYRTDHAAWLTHKVTGQLFYSWKVRIEDFEEEQGPMDLAESLLMEKLQLSATPAVERPIAVVASPPNGWRTREASSTVGSSTMITRARMGTAMTRHQSSRRRSRSMKAMEASRPQQAPIAVDPPPPVSAALAAGEGEGVRDGRQGCGGEQCVGCWLPTPARGASEGTRS